MSSLYTVIFNTVIYLHNCNISQEKKNATCKSDLFFSQGNICVTIEILTKDQFCPRCAL